MLICLNDFVIYEKKIDLHFCVIPCYVINGNYVSFALLNMSLIHKTKTKSHLNESHQDMFGFLNIQYSNTGI